MPTVSLLGRGSQQIQQCASRCANVLHRQARPMVTGREVRSALAEGVAAVVRPEPYGSFTYPCRIFHKKYFSKAILAAWDCGPGIITPCLRGGSMRSARITTPLLPASMMHTAGMSPKLSFLVGSWPRICAAMFSAATWAMVSAGKPVLGTPTALAVVHGAFTAAAIPTA